MHTCTQARIHLQTPKINKAAWAKLVAALVRAAMPPHLASQREANVSDNNETFLNQPNLYKKNRMSSVKIAPNSGDFNPIEVVWARLCRDLAVREIADLKAGRCLSVCQYKRWASQTLTSYSVPQCGESMSYLSRLLRSLPCRLATCKANWYGPCGK